MSFLSNLFGKKQPADKPSSSSPSSTSAPSTARSADDSSVTPVDASALDLLLQQPYGSALPMSVNVSGQVATAFVFRESEERWAELGRSGDLGSLQTRGAGLDVGGVQIYVTLFRIGDQVFEIWWNYHNPIIRPLFDRLFDQKEIIVGFVSEQPKFIFVERHPSPVRDKLRANKAGFTNSEPWTMDAFDKARAAVEEKYPTPVALWMALGGGK